MVYFWAQMVLAARNGDFEGWMQILIVVIMVVVYALSGIIKAAKSRKLEDKKEQEQQGGPFDGSTELTTGQARPASPAAAQPQQPETVRAKKEPQVHPVGKITSRGQAIEETISNGVKPQLAIPKQQTELKPGIERLPEFISETVQGLEYQATAGYQARRRPTLEAAPTSKGARVAVPAEIAEATGSTRSTSSGQAGSPYNYFGEPLLDVSDPEAIRRAILHYEIFGKPMSLRGPGEQIIGL